MSAAADTFRLALACSLSDNALCGLGHLLGTGTYTAKGIIKLSEALKVNATLTSLKCASPPAPARFGNCQQPLTLLLTPVCSLDSNNLCGLDYRGRGTYTAEGIIQLSDALKVNATLTSLRCASSPSRVGKCQ